MREKRADGITAQAVRMLLVVEKDVTLDSHAICLLSTQAEVAQTRNLTDFVEKFRFRHGDGSNGHCALMRGSGTYLIVELNRFAVDLIIRPDQILDQPQLVRLSFTFLVS